MPKLLLQFSLLILFSAGTLLMAQPEPVPQPQVNTELLTLAIHQPVSGLFWFDGEEVQPFQSVPRGLGIPHAYRGPAELLLHHQAESFLPEAAPVRPAARIQLPLHADRVLILTGDPQQLPLQAKAIPLDSDKIQAGDYWVFNLSHNPIALKLGEQTLRVSPGSSGKLSDPAWKTDVLDLPVYVAFYRDGKKNFYSSVWGHRPVRRNYLFVVNTNGPESPPRIRRTYDLPPVKIPSRE